MEFDLIKLIQDLGLPVGLVVWFLYKDYKFTSHIVALMTKVDLYMAQQGARKDGAA